MAGLVLGLLSAVFELDNKKQHKKRLIKENERYGRLLEEDDDIWISGLSRTNQWIIIL